MSTTREIRITVVEEAKQSRPIHLEREAIISIEDKKTSSYHKSEGINQSAIQDLINSFGLNPNNLKFEIGWKPSEGKSVLFNNLKSSANKLTISIYWFIRESGKLAYSRSVAINGGQVNKPAISKGQPPNATQFVEFTATSFKASPA